MTPSAVQYVSGTHFRAAAHPGCGVVFSGPVYGLGLGAGVTGRLVVSYTDPPIGTP
jgi:hypothetical protein